MPPKPASSSKRSAKPISSSKVSTLKLDVVPGPPPTKKQKLKPLISLSKAPVFDLTCSQPSQSAAKDASGSQDVKGKKKAIVQSWNTPSPSSGNQSSDSIAVHDTQMWVDMYEPLTEETLAVHVRKVQDIRQWLQEAFEGGPSGKLRKYRRILVLTGPAGTAKTATLRVLSRELGFEISEWKNGVDDRPSLLADFDPYDDYEGMNERFDAFVARAANCRPIFAAESTDASQASTSQSSGQKQVILLEDLPNILHEPTQQAFHAALQAVASHSSHPIAPIVIIISDAGLRGESGQEDVGSNAGWRPRGKDAVDVRTVLPPSLLVSPYVTQIRFNPIAPTLMKKALQHLVTTHFSSSTQTLSAPPTKDVLDVVVESSNGDIRSAIMALQFACISGSSGLKTKGRSRGKKATVSESRALLETVTRREQSLALFHLVGKLLYNKRKGDAPIQSAAKKDIERDKAVDARLKDPPKLPKHLGVHERKASRVDVEALYADSPIDSSLLSLYIHQNYTQYCNELDECGGIVDWLSWVDYSGGEHWYSANPHRFHLVSLGTLHSLPCPVVRRGQKPYKPEFFDVMKTEREIADSIIDVHDWLQRDEHGGAGGWSRQNIALELGGVLKARDMIGHKASTAPSSHRLFSRLQFSKGPSGLTELADEADDAQQDALLMAESEDAAGPDRVQESEADLGGWLEDDDIEDA
ncbi:Rad17 cell cycle checkpoint protein-domain-containing protein [Cristinia sonorae]|uniref:Rad17 cell cycle checkpoint protein-domain-containing protein n=1 Tax=Cristinia sonorae TaxID=1940300 RepID=A0A8K0ULI4_9AGAR|nr:Rad17 cell cycle checkpoint protein-domain-containing protein [Cristinia sonorae]